MVMWARIPDLLPGPELLYRTVLTFDDVAAGKKPPQVSTWARFLPTQGPSALTVRNPQHEMLLTWQPHPPLQPVNTVHSVSKSHFLKSMSHIKKITRTPPIVYNLFNASITVNCETVRFPRYSTLYKARSLLHGRHFKPKPLPVQGS